MPRFHVYAAVLTVIMVGWAVLAGTTRPMAAGMRISEDYKGVPAHVGGWTGTDGPIDELGYWTLSTCSFLNRNYTDSAGNSVNLSIVYGRDLGDFHKPEICMSGAGWNPTRSDFVWLHPKGSAPHQATVARLANKDGVELVMVYWFYMNGTVTPSLASKGEAFWKALITQKLPPSAMVKFTAQVVGDEETTKKSAMGLSELLEPAIVDVVSRPPKFIPSDTPLPPGAAE